MEPNVQVDLEQIKAHLLEGMREYMTNVSEGGDDPGYSDADIAKCESILDDFLAAVRSAATADSALVLAVVKDAVLSLNALNESCDHSLIETDQREQLCELIIQGAVAAGVGSGEDITEQWREW